ncbi:MULTISPECIES: ECs1072 family phage-associated protein [Proteus]|uniref:Uncharacterized protein n=1 Tax=Proteus penneri TaxID=102862 RepID=A0A0G4PZH4_9GAMM|nr:MULTISPECIES: hypothetical protein [Proteus]AYY80295.1 hypothetical protein EGX81_05190 [Proteus vulgaris]CRL59042.1 hypothetical protein BN1804_00214 [Proteus penneri]
MSNYSNLFQIIKMRVCRNNKESDSMLDMRNDHRSKQVWHRIEQIFILECLLDEYRKKHGSLHSPLDGKKALHHMILNKTNWPLSEIKALSFNDCILIITEYLKKENIHPDAQDFLNRMNLPTNSYPLDDFSEEDWAPKENAPFLQKDSEI